MTTHPYPSGVLGLDLALFHRRRSEGWAWGDFTTEGPRHPMWRLTQDDVYAHEAALAARVPLRPPTGTP